MNIIVAVIDTARTLAVELTMVTVLELVFEDCLVFVGDSLISEVKLWLIVPDVGWGTIDGESSSEL